MSIFIINFVLFGSCVQCLGKPNSVLIAVKHRVVELHEVISPNEEVIEALLAHIEGSNGVITLATIVRAIDSSLHPVVRWNRVFDIIDNVSQVTKAEFVLTVEIFVVIIFIEFHGCPAGECDERGTSIGSEEAFFVVTQM